MLTPDKFDHFKTLGTTLLTEGSYGKIKFTLIDIGCEVVSDEENIYRYPYRDTGVWIYFQIDNQKRIVPIRVDDVPFVYSSVSYQVGFYHFLLNLKLIKSNFY